MPLDDLTRTTKPESFDPETRTFEAVIATPSPVTRHDARGEFREVLDPATLKINEDTLPLLDSHRTGSVRDLLGEATSIRVDGLQVVAALRLTSAEDAGPIAQRIADGSLTGLSIGYRVNGWREFNGPDGRTKTPTAWEITEVTLTSAPADPAARIRSDLAPAETARVGGNSENRADGDSQMETETIAPEEAERTRRSEIRTLVRSAGLGVELADDLIDQDASIAEAKAAVFDETQNRTSPAIRTHATQNDDPAVITRRQSDAIAYRMGGAELSDESRQYADLSLIDLARDAVERSGVSVRGLTRDEILHRAAHSTSDFPLVVSNAVGKTAQEAYRAAESPLKQLCRKTTLRDFKATTAIKLGEMGELAELAESGEFTATTRAETGESMALKTYGRRIDVSRNLIVNDDLNLLGDMTREFGEAAAQTEATLLVAQITGNPTMSDGTAVFDASRENVAGTAGVPSTATLSAAREAMRKRTGTDGETLIDAAPKFMLVGAHLETTAEEILASIQPSNVSDVNVFAGKLTLLVEPRLPEGFWYLFSDPARLASLRYGYLAGAEGVQVQRREQWDTLGLGFRAYLDFGAGWLDWRGAHRTAES